jgi:hypothetical protein
MRSTISRAHAIARAGAVEAGEEAIAGGVDLDAAETRELDADQVVVAFQEAAPLPVAELHGLDRRADEIGEEDRGEHGVRNPPRGRPDEERLDGLEREVVLLDRSPYARDERVLGTRYHARHVLGVLTVALLGEHKRWHPDRRQSVTDVELDLHAPEVNPGGGA